MYEGSLDMSVYLINEYIYIRSVLVSLFSRYGVVVCTNEAMHVLHAAIANSCSILVK